MTKDSQDAGIAAQNTGFTGFDPFVMMRSFIPTMNESSIASSNPIANWLEMNQHWTTFLTKRLEKDAALLQKLTTPSGPAELNVAYSDFFQKTVEDYQREFAEIAEFQQNALGKVEMMGETKASQKEKPNGKG